MVMPRSIATWPSSGCSSPVIIRNSVVLPDPLGPTSPTFSPLCSAAEASMKSRWWPFCLEMLSRRIMGTRVWGMSCGCCRSPDERSDIRAVYVSFPDIAALIRATKLHLLALLPLHRLPADVAAAEALGPADPIHRLIGAVLRLGDGFAHRADIEHASAIGEDLAVFRHRAGVEDFDAF